MRVPDPKEIIEDIKFNYGDYNYVPPTMDTTPVFAYDYLSLNKSKLCFDNIHIRGGQFMEYFYAVKELSKKRISELFAIEENHFHQINLDKKRFLIRPIKELLGIEEQRFVDQSSLPIFAQFATETDPDGDSPRVIFFLGKYGVFHIMFFDIEHSVYKMDVNKK